MYIDIRCIGGIFFETSKRTFKRKHHHAGSESFKFRRHVWLSNDSGTKKTVRSNFRPAGRNLIAHFAQSGKPKLHPFLLERKRPGTEKKILQHHSGRKEVAVSAEKGMESLC